MQGAERLAGAATSVAVEVHGASGLGDRFGRLGADLARLPLDLLKAVDGGRGVFARNEVGDVRQQVFDLFASLGHDTTVSYTHLTLPTKLEV